MDGIHDLGGMHGFGPVVVEACEPVFHERWEATARALAGAVARTPGGGSPSFRHSIERMDPAHYLSSSYYEHWLTAAATLAVERGFVEPAELEARCGGSFPIARPISPAAAAESATTMGSGGAEPRFAVGDRVRVRDRHPSGHTRCPRYVRGRAGVVARLDVRAPLPEVEAHGDALWIEPTYCVRFDPGALWPDGDGGARNAWLHVDLWQSYLEPDA